MSVEKLQEKIRKTKSPVIVDLTMLREHIPETLRTAVWAKEYHGQYCRELLTALKGVVAGVRFSFDHWALMDGLDELSALMELANNLGYYVLLDAPAMLTPWASERAAALLDDHWGFPCHGMVADPYIGSDAMKPFLPYCKEGKSVFFAVRCPNRSASELQDLMTGSRLVHMAAAEQLDRLGKECIGKSGYSQMGALTAGNNINAVRQLRDRHPHMFLLVDGLDYPGGNSRICAYGFDRLGHGCAVSVGPVITAAWQKEDAAPENYIAHAVQAAERVRTNLARYVMIL